MIKITSLIFSTLLPLFLFAQTQANPGASARQTTLRFGVAIPARFASARELLEPALMIVDFGAPEGVLLKQAGSADQLDFIIEVTDSKTATNSGQEQIRNFSQTNGDAYSIFFSEDKSAPIIVRVLWDIATEEKTTNGKTIERADAFTRLVVLLGHEIYGNVMFFKKQKALLTSNEYAQNKSVKAKAELESEINAFQKGVEFIDRILKKVAPQLGAKIQNDFKEARIRESAVLKQYEAQATKNSYNGISFAPTCESKLNPK